jgi:hypothetical protein
VVVVAQAAILVDLLQIRHCKRSRLAQQVRVYRMALGVLAETQASDHCALPRAARAAVLQALLQFLSQVLVA